jgi:GxxExxY protein
MNRQAANDASLQEPEAELDAWAQAVVQAAIEVHHQLGPNCACSRPSGAPRWRRNFLESVYQQALCVELGLRRVPYQQQVPIEVQYKGRRVGQACLDLLVGRRLVVELKAVDSLLPIHIAQVISYLKATRQRLGLLINFKVSFLQKGLKRVILTQSLGGLGGLGGSLDA